EPTGPLPHVTGRSGRGDRRRYPPRRKFPTGRLQSGPEGSIFKLALANNRSLPVPVTELEQRLDRIDRRLLSLENAVGLARPPGLAAAPVPASPLPPALPAATGPVPPPPPPPQSPASSPALADALRQLNALRAAVAAAPGADEPW